MKKIKIINIVLDVIIILLFILLIFNISTKDNKTKEKEEVIDLTDNKTKNLSDEFYVKDLKFYNSEIISVKNYKSTISVNILNNSDDSYYIKGITAIIYNKNKKEEIALYNDVSLIIEPKQNVVYVFESDKDLYEFTYSIEYVPIYEVYQDNI